MAEDQNSPDKSNTFLKGMVKDADGTFQPEGAWYHLRNGINNSKDGHTGTVGNEPSTKICIPNSLNPLDVPYIIIGVVHLLDDRWVIFSTDNTNSEIGFFDEGLCKYTQIVRDTCLAFNTHNLITGQSKESYDCTWHVYWDDGLNPSRVLNIGNISTAPYSQPWPGVPYMQTCVDENLVVLPGPPNYISVGCVTCTNNIPLQLDCDLIRLQSLMKTPCLELTRGTNGGTVLNGSYYAIIAYTLNGERVTDYFLPSDIQPIFEHLNVAGSLILTIKEIDKKYFDYFDLVIVRTINQQTSAKRIGNYSVRQAQIFIDYINEALPSIPVEDIPFISPTYERSESMHTIGPHLVRLGPTSKFDFNYQPLANQIVTKWSAIAYPADFYAKGGNKTSYMRDEVYPFFVRFIYTTGDKSASYHIPGRPFIPSDTAAPPAGSVLDITETQTWQTINTATIVPILPINQITLPDGGVEIADGYMGYWESTEKYPDDKAEMFNPSINPWTAIAPGSQPYQLSVPPLSGTTIPQYDTCGDQIRHHKFPENRTITHYDAALGKIILLGVKFENVRPPVDNAGNLIPGIAGFEILRGSREGNKTVIAKGIINNMRVTTLDSGPTVLFQNYPYNPQVDIGPYATLGDPFLSEEETSGGATLSNAFDDPTTQNPSGGLSKNQFSFHSPDTSFNNPYLSSRELKLYGELSGKVEGSFDEQPEHPKHKLITDFTFVISALLGIGNAIMAIKGQRRTSYISPYVSNIGMILTGPGSSGFAPSPAGSGAAGAAALITYRNTFDQEEVEPTGGATLLSLVASLFGDEPLLVTTYKNAAVVALSTPGVSGGQENIETDQSDFGYLPKFMKTTNSLVMFSNYWSKSTEAVMELIKALIPFTQYAMRYTSHGFMDNYAIGNVNAGNFRHIIADAIYVDDQFQDFNVNPLAQTKINNLYRSKTVVLQTLASNIPRPLTIDNSVQTIGSCVRGDLGLPVGTLVSFEPDDAKEEFNTTACSQYAAMKKRMRNQYGQLEGIVQIPASTCPVYTTGLAAPYSTAIVFNGDTYVCRYTEKNTFFYFWDWLYDQPDGYEWNYKLRYMLNFPRYWADFTDYDINEFITGGTIDLTAPPFVSIPLPNDRARLDGANLNQGSIGSPGLFRMKNRYFYTFNSAVRDFYVESVINTELRDWGDPMEQRYYDPNRFSDVRTLFDPKIIKSGNFVKYDTSLSISRVFNNFFPWGSLQKREYNPTIAETCFVFYPNKLIYSLPQTLESVKDFWRVFLVNNDKDFKHHLISIKPLGMTGAVLLFDTASPQIFQGVDELKTDAGVKITVGDGALFDREPQNIINADSSYEYGSCQDSLGVINTPSGLFWMSANQGKIFNYAGGLREISNLGMKWWMTRYLPFKILEDFPDFSLTNNPVAGVGCQSIFDNKNGIVYFTKKDFKRKPGLIGAQVILDSTYEGFVHATLGFPIILGDPMYFDDASWTLSYDIKSKEGQWLGFHDWHPDLSIPSKNDFLTTVHTPANQGQIWRHGVLTNSYCNYYGIDYPFEIDYIASTGQQVTTVRSIEYLLECYIYDEIGTDAFHVLDANFDHAVVYNSEQVSGILILNVVPKNDIVQTLQYPIVNATSIDILAAKVEQKYRINQFWDITEDRGEFTFPTVQRKIWQTESNGYIRILNPANLFYGKSPLQRKKFRHYTNHVMFYKNISGNIKMYVKLINTKELISVR